MELEILSDPDIYIFFEKGTRGGVSYISNRYSKSSNKYLKLVFEISICLTTNEKLLSFIQNQC